MLKKLKTLFRNTAIIVGVIVVVLGFIWAFFSITFQSLYIPIRLYATGEIKEMKVVSKDLDFRQGRYGPYDISYKVKMEGYEGEFPLSNTEIYEDLREGQLLNVYYSDKLQFGIVSDSKLSLYECFIYDSVHSPYLTIFLYTIIILSLSIYSLKITVRKFRDIIHEYNDKKENETNKLVRGAKLSAFLVPYTLIIAVIYLLSWICLKAIFLVENMSDFLGGVVLTLSFILILFSPYYVIRIRHSFSKVNFVKFSLGIIKSIAGIYTTIMLIRFLSSNDLKEFKNIQQALLEIVKLLVGY